MQAQDCISSRHCSAASTIRYPSIENAKPTHVAAEEACSVGGDQLRKLGEDVSEPVARLFRTFVFVGMVVRLLGCWVDVFRFGHA